METTILYTLSDETGVRYLGKSKDLKKRYINHICESHYKRTRKEKWIWSLLQKGQSPVMEILEVVPLIGWQEHEMYWIAQLKAWGFDMVNGTEGGEGSDGFRGKTHTEETKRKMSESMKAKGIRNSNPGAKNGAAKLDEAQVRIIKSRLDESNVKLAREFGVSDTVISYIRNGKTWSHVV